MSLSAIPLLAVSSALFATTVVLPSEPVSDPTATNAEPAPGITRNIRIHNAGKTSGDLPMNMVEVEGGKMRRGISKKALEEFAKLLGVDDGELSSDFGKLTAMYPENDIEVDTLLVDKFEVSNQQFKTYLEANGLEPSADLLDLNWNFWEKGEKKTGLPPGKEGHPVRGINSIEAERCAHFLGKRLPTEEEWEYFARKELKSDFYYPWAKGWKGWDSKLCANARNSNQGSDGIHPWPVGTWKEDSAGEIMDLCGNVGEWTSSPFDAYTGWQPFEFKVRKKKVNFRAEFNSEYRTIRGGSCRGNEITNNLVVRWGEHPRNASEFVGFRCVSSALPGLDQLRYAEARDLTLMKADLKDKLAYNLDAIVAQQVQYMDLESNLVRGSAHFAFTRVDSLPMRQSTLEKKSVDEPVPVGIFTTTASIADPALPPGSYAVYFKGAGLSKEQKEAQKAREEAEKAAKKDKKGTDDEKDKKDDKSKKDDEKKDDGKKEGSDEKEEGEGEEEPERELTEEEKKILEEEARLQADLEKIGAVATASAIDILDIPTDRHVLIIRNEAGDDVAWVEAGLDDVALHPTRFAVIAGGGTQTAAAPQAGNATLLDQGPNDLVHVQFAIKAGTSSKYPQFNLKLQFKAGAFEPVAMPAEESGKKRRGR